MRGQHRLRAWRGALRLRREAFASLVRRRNRRGPDGLLLPPPSFIEAVAGNADVAWFLDGGARAHASIVAALRDAGIAAADLGGVLDFGCGCGRVARHWRPAGAGTRLYGVDTNRYLVAWCAQSLRFGSFTVSTARPPLRLASGSLDVAYALSVFTHLPEAAQRQWLAELARVLRGGGHLLLSTHGEASAALLPPALREGFDAGCLVVSALGKEGGNGYNAFHPRTCMEELAAPHFEVVGFHPQGAAGNPPQDLYLLRRPAGGADP
jgi:SAM-dependent methyltransferase